MSRVDKNYKQTRNWLVDNRLWRQGIIIKRILLQNGVRITLKAMSKTRFFWYYVTIDCFISPAGSNFKYLLK